MLYLSNLPSLRVLWLSHNPCADHQYYRPFVIKTLPSLVKLDNNEITQDERIAAMSLNFDGIIHGAQNVGSGIDRNNNHTPQMNKKSS